MMNENKNKRTEVIVKSKTVINMKRRETTIA